MALSECVEGAPVARVYASNWLDDARENVVEALREAGYAPVLGELGEQDSLPTDAALFVFGEQAGCRTGLELLLVTRATEQTANTPVLLFGPGRETAVLAAWQAGADAYLTNPSSSEVLHFLTELRNATRPG